MELEPEEGVAPIQLVRIEDFLLGSIRVQPSLKKLIGDGNRELELEPRAMQVLVALHQATHRPVSHDRLIDLCWNGSVVGDNAISRAISQLRKALSELEARGVEIETVPRVGYRLVVEPLATEESNRTLGSLPAWRKIVTTVLILGLGLILAFQWQPIDGSEDRRIALAVLPFVATGTENELLAQGLSGELRSLLAQNPGFAVPGITSTEVVKNGKQSPREIGLVLGVDYLVEGELKLDKTSQIFWTSLSLIEARSGKTLMTERFEGRVAETFDLQGAILSSIVDYFALGGTEVGSGVAEAPKGYAYARYLIAMGLIKQRTRVSMSRATAILENLTSEEPNFAPGWAALAVASTLNASGEPDSSEFERYRHTAEKAINRALALDQRQSDALAAKGLLLTHPAHKDIERARKSLELAVKFNPENVQAWYWLATVYSEMDEFEATVDASERVIELEPYWSRSQSAVDWAYDLGHRDRAQQLREKTAMRHPRLDVRYRSEAQAAAERGDWSGAMEWLDRSIGVSEDLAFDREWVFRYLQIPPDPGRPPALPEAIVLQSADAPIDQVFTAIKSSSQASIEISVESSGMMARFYSDGHCDYIARLAKYIFGPDLAFPIDARASSYAALSLTPWLALCDPFGEGADLLVEAEKIFDRRFAKQNMPRAYAIAGAQIKAMRGKSDEALELIKEATRKGWPNGLPNTSVHSPMIAKLADNPLLSSLQSSAEFQAIASEIETAWRRERAETLTYLEARSKAS